MVGPIIDSDYQQLPPLVYQGGQLHGQSFTTNSRYLLSEKDASSKTRDVSHVRDHV